MESIFLRISEGILFRFSVLSLRSLMQSQFFFFLETCFYFLKVFVSSVLIFIHNVPNSKIILLWMQSILILFYLSENGNNSTFSKFSLTPLRIVMIVFFKVFFKTECFLQLLKFWIWLWSFLLGFLQICIDSWFYAH